MAEIYRNSIGKGITCAVASVGVTSATIIRDDKRTAGVLSGNSVAIPFPITKNDGGFAIEWNVTVEGENHTITEHHEVVTPLFTKPDLDFDDTWRNLDPEAVVRLETLVRKIIEVYTGQQFGFRTGYLRVYGNGETTLRTPERVVSLQDSSYRVSGDGYLIYARPPVENSIKGVPVDKFGVYEPFLTGTGRFALNQRYKVYGEFGWLTVPEDVKQAALALAEQFTCDESLWRDRYIKAIRAADWRFDFSDLAFVGTGSVIADQLLAPYIVNRAAVI